MKDPAAVAIPKSLHRVVGVVFLITPGMMPDVIPAPPQRRVFQRPPAGHQKAGPDPSRAFETSMRDQAVIAHRDTESAGHIQHAEHDPVERRKADLDAEHRHADDRDQCEDHKKYDDGVIKLPGRFLHLRSSCWIAQPRATAAQRDCCKYGIELLRWFSRKIVRGVYYLFISLLRRGRNEEGMKLTDSVLEPAIHRIGRELAERSARSSPTVFDPRWWSGNLLEWCMKDESFKVQLFRFIDVLPCLRDDAHVARLLEEYFGETETLAPSLQWGLRAMSATRLGARLSAKSLRHQIHQMARTFIAEASIESAVPVLARLWTEGRGFSVAITFDMEQAELKDLTLMIFMRLLPEAAYRRYPHGGIAMQAYLTESAADLHGLIRWVRQRGTPVTVRLVKGAYWDSDSIRYRQRGWPVPVFKTKAETDHHYELLSRTLVEHAGFIRPAFGTHSLRSLAHAQAAAEAAGLAPGAPG